MRFISTRVTTHPTAEWTARVLNFEITEGEAPAGIVHDRDPAFESAQFRDLPSLNQVKNLGCPSMAMQRALKEYQTCYNRFRPHQGIDQKIPNLPENRASRLQGSEETKVLSKPYLEGLHYHYFRAAA